MQHILYFSYGSNMSSRRLKNRVESARVISSGILEKYKLIFHKVSDDGSGKCDAFFADEVNDAFNKVSQHPITLKKKRFLNLFMKTRPARQRSLWIAENVINEGGFENVSKLAMANRLIGLGLVRGLGYQKL